MTAPMLQGEDTVHHDLPVEVLAAVLAWTKASLQAGELPEFGSCAWVDLDDDNPAKMHAAIRAACGWWNGRAFGCDIPVDVFEAEFNRRHKLAAVDVSMALDWAQTSRELQVWQRIMRIRAGGYGPLEPLPTPAAELSEAFDGADSRMPRQRRGPGAVR